MKPTRALALALLLAACSTSQPTTNEASCARQADSDPTVKDILEKSAGSPDYARNHEEALKAARQDATVACLRTRGIVRGGGVERQRPL